MLLSGALSYKSVASCWERTINWESFQAFWTGHNTWCVDLFPGSFWHQLNRLLPSVLESAYNQESNQKIAEWFRDHVMILPKVKAKVAAYERLCNDDTLYDPTHSDPDSQLARLFENIQAAGLDYDLYRVIKEKLEENSFLHYALNFQLTPHKDSRFNYLSKAFWDRQPPFFKYSLKSLPRSELDAKFFMFAEKTIRKEAATISGDVLDQFIQRWGQRAWTLICDEDLNQGLETSLITVLGAYRYSQKLLEETESDAVHTGDAATGVKPKSYCSDILVEFRRNVLLEIAGELTELEDVAQALLLRFMMAFHGHNDQTAQIFIQTFNPSSLWAWLEKAVRVGETNTEVVDFCHEVIESLVPDVFFSKAVDDVYESLLDDALIVTDIQQNWIAEVFEEKILEIATEEDRVDGESRALMDECLDSVIKEKLTRIAEAAVAVAAEEERIDRAARDLMNELSFGPVGRESLITDVQREWIRSLNCALSVKDVKALSQEALKVWAEIFGRLYDHEKSLDLENFFKAVTMRLYKLEQRQCYKQVIKIVLSLVCFMWSTAYFANEKLQQLKAERLTEKKAGQAPTIRT